VSAGEADRYTFDTSAILAFFTNEPGADQVEKPLTSLLSLVELPLERSRRSRKE